MRWFITVIFFSFSLPVIGQTTDPNILSDLDDYSILRTMVQNTFDTREFFVNYEYKLHKKEIGLIEYFIDGKSFKTKSNLDIYNRILYADFDKDGIMLPHKFDNQRIDSLYLYKSEVRIPSKKYFYHPKLDRYAEVISQGKFTIVESFEFSFQKGNINPVLDSDSFEDKIKLKKIPYLVDMGHWHRIPKNKNEFLNFARIHFRKKLEKPNLKGYTTKEFAIKLNKRESHD